MDPVLLQLACASFIKGWCTYRWEDLRDAMQDLSEDELLPMDRYEPREQVHRMMGECTRREPVAARSVHVQSA